MAVFEIFFKASVWKDFKQIPKRDTKKILRKIEALGDDPRPVGCEKLSGDDKFRIRQGRYRIVYSVQDKALTVWVVKVGHQKDVYR
jgi:mRNA interferase RelE/StbE